MAWSCQSTRRFLSQLRQLTSSRQSLRLQRYGSIAPVIKSSGYNNINHKQSFNYSSTIDDDKMTKILDKEEETLNNLLDTALEEVLTHGWKMSAVAAACERLGYPAVTAGLVDNVEQLVLHHINTSNRKLDAWMQEEVERLTEGGQRLRIGPFVRSCVVTRLSMNIPYLQAGVWSEGVALLCGSGEGVAGGVEAWQTVCDDIWFRAGDQSHDLNWYTKRLTLCAVMAATDIFMLQDTSQDYQETWSFLDRRLEDLQLAPTLSKIPEDVAQVAGGILQTAKILVGAQR